MKSHRIFPVFLFLAAIASLVSPTMYAQPYVDPFQIRYTHGFRSKDSYATPFTHRYAGSDLPLRIKENTYLLLSPYYESWNINSADKEVAPLVKALHCL